MPAEILVTKDILAEDAVFILQCLRESEREGRSTHMMDVRGYLANSVTLEFSDYLRFLRKFGYVEVDREQHTLALTENGEKAAHEGDPALEARLSDFFAEKLEAGVIEVQTEESESDALGQLVGGAVRPPPPPEDLTPMPGPGPLSRKELEIPPSVSPFANVLPPGAGGSVEDELIYLRGELIGQGPLGSVYAGRHASLGTAVAVKEIREDAARRIFNDYALLGVRLKEELGAQARLRHPGIVLVHDLDVTVPQPFAVLELCEGGSLRSRLQVSGGKGLSVPHALQAFGQLLSALSAVHEAGLVHQNLKAENVLFDRHGNAKVADLGFSRLLVMGGAGDARQIVDTGAVSYLAPELMVPGGKATAASDVYALGILLYEALTGRVPGRRSPEPSKAVEGAPAELDELFDLMVADRAEDRYPTAAAVLEDFHAAFPDGRWGSPGQVQVATRPPEPVAAPAKAESKPPARRARR